MLVVATPEPTSLTDAYATIKVLASQQQRRVIELLVNEALSRSGGNQTVAARLLGITQSALSKRLKSARE